MSKLLDRSLDQISRDRQKDLQPSSISSGQSSRNSPYSRPRPDTEGTWKHDLYQGDSKGPSSRRVAGGGALKPTPKLTVENLHYEVTEPELKSLFEQIGPLNKAYIKYDRSGRSTGTAVVIYQDVQHATEAKDEYDGAKAKGQVITITQEMRPDRPIQRSNNNPSSKSTTTSTLGRQAEAEKNLLSRFDLLSRLGGPKSEPPSHAPRGPKTTTTAAAARTTRRQEGGAQRGVGGNSIRGGGGGGRNNQREKRKPATAADLDAELEAFMKAPSSTVKEMVKNSGTKDSIHAVQDNDVEMS
ncbi:hypothetical protein IE53DRAFT_384336 [Violaceomyces palustris]|uniref:Uncharacterized protein n=1 Tax=Violaceomyces palustris TaxID=1673888 RepID=A0ACD0P565_9BASI|nr:hypothetical protein IE53DRAFT_384336 [Violaceomyces palustris]